MSAAFPPILVISLEHSRERREIMAARLTALGLDFEFVDAVYGRRLTADEVSAGYNSFKRNLFFNKHMSLPEIGCLYSHRKACQTMLDKGLSHAVILEDDAILANDFAEAVRDVMKLSDKWDLIRFVCREKAGRTSRRVVSIGQGKSLVRFRATPAGAYGYLLSAKAAGRLLERSAHAWMPLDIMYGHLWLTGLRTYGVWPSPVACDDDIASTIGDERFERAGDAGALKALYYPFTRFAMKTWEFALKRLYFYGGALVDRRRFGGAHDPDSLV